MVTWLSPVAVTHSEEVGKERIYLSYTSQNQKDIREACTEYESLLSLANLWTQMEFQEINKEND